MTKIVLITAFMGLKTVIWDNCFPQGVFLYESFQTLKLLDCLRSGPRVFYTLRKRKWSKGVLLPL